ncbi:MAG: hypothetical protein ACOYMV_14655 [Verrucomicrobiia bacterium]
MKLSIYFRHLRDRQGITLERVAQNAHQHRSTVWKVEHSKPIRVSTLKRLATKGLDLSTDSEEYRTLIGLWTSERGGYELASVDVPEETRRVIRRSKLYDQTKFDVFMRSILPLLRVLEARHWPAVEKALARPPVLEALNSLHRLYERKLPS